MTDDDLEQSLLAHYRSIDPTTAPRGLGRRIEHDLEYRAGRPAFTVRARSAFAVALAAVLVVAVGLGFRPGGFLSPAGVSPTPTASIVPSLPSQSSSPSASAIPTPLLPGGSTLPISSATWAGLRLEALDGGPVGASSVVAWSGGYLALGQSSDRAPLPAWISRDGRAWVALPSDTFGPASLALAVPCADGVVVAIETATGETTVWRSTDGATWTPTPSSRMRLGRDSDLAGSQTGAVAILDGYPYRLAFSADGLTWQDVSLPGSGVTDVQGVAAFGTGFVAVGDAGATAGSPIAWSSADGLHWTRAAVQAHPGGFNDVHAAHSGLVAFSLTGGTPGVASFWTSADGRSWKISTADPLGVWSQGEGQGSANGLFSADGTRLLGYGIRADGKPTEYWTSFDGIHWTRLALSGDTAATVSGQVTPFLLRDGILFSGTAGTWFGTVVR